MLPGLVPGKVPGVLTFFPPGMTPGCGARNGCEPWLMMTGFVGVREGVAWGSELRVGEWSSKGSGLPPLPTSLKAGLARAMVAARVVQKTSAREFMRPD